MITKKDVIVLLEKIALYMELKGENAFKISAFRKAANALESDERSLKEIEDFTTISGIGKGTASVINEFIEEGTSATLEELKKEIPEGLIPLLKLPGLGGKKVAKLYQELQITNMDELKVACEEEKVQTLAGFAKKTEEKILVAIAEVGSRPERLPLAFVLPIAAEIDSQLKEMKGIQRYSKAGSLRRLRETVKDLDFIIATDEPLIVREQLLKLKHVKDIISNGETKVSLVLAYEYDISIDFRLVKQAEFITTLHHFTGSKDHNVRMRQLGKERGEKISEYGVENVATGEVITFENEEAFFGHFDLPYIPPELREDGKEVDAFQVDYPLISINDIQGDLHMHTTWSDGALSLEEMVQACIQKGYSYMAITDHSKYLKVANGLNEERLQKQGEEILRLREKYPQMMILRGIEMDILPDGTLDFEDDILEQLDFVIASIHSSFSQNRATIMKRLATALQNNHVHMIAHPTGRIIGGRSGYDVDIEMLIQLARETNTVLELNANAHRLDLEPKYLKLAQEQGVLLAINTDAHKQEMLDDMEIGVSTARKAWIKTENVINTWSKDELITFLKKKKR